MNWPASRLCRRFFAAGLLVLALVSQCAAEQGVLVVHVEDVGGHPVSGVEIGTRGDGGAAVTDRNGKARIKLAPQTRANTWITLQVVASPAGKDYVMVSPWDSRHLVPSFENETENYVPVVVAARGDRDALQSGRALKAIVAKINQVTAPRSKEATTEEQRRAALAETAKDFGLKPEEVDQAIRAWGARSQDPYEKGLAALYERNYPEATKRLSESLEVREKQLAIAQAEVRDSAFFLGQSLFEQGRYRESSAAYRKALQVNLDDSTVLNDLGLSLNQAGDYAGAEPLLRRALATREKAMGSDHPYVATSLNNLALLLFAKGDYAGAEPLLRRALAINEKALGPEGHRGKQNHF